MKSYKELLEGCKTIAQVKERVEEEIMRHQAYEQFAIQQGHKTEEQKKDELIKDLKAEIERLKEYEFMYKQLNK